MNGNSPYPGTTYNGNPQASQLTGQEIIPLLQSGRNRYTTASNFASLVSGIAVGVTQIITDTGLSGGPITSTGTIFIPPSGITTSLIADKAVTFSKIVDSTASKLIGNPFGTTSSLSEISLGVGLAFSGSTLYSTVTGGGGGSGTVTQVSAGSGLTGGPITSSGTLSVVLGAGLAFSGNQIINTSGAAGSGTVFQVATGTGLSGGPITSSGTVFIANNGVNTAQISGQAVTYAKIQNATALRLIGNPTTGAASVSEISLGSALAFSGSVLTVTGTLSALANFNTTGIIVQTAPSTFTGRSIIGTTNQVNVIAGNGVTGNPTLSLPQDIHTTASPTFSAISLGTVLSAVAPIIAFNTLSSIGTIRYSGGAGQYYIGTNVDIGLGPQTQMFIGDVSSALTGLGSAIAGVGSFFGFGGYLSIAFMEGHSPTDYAVSSDGSSAVFAVGQNTGSPTVSNSFCGSYTVFGYDGSSVIGAADIGGVSDEAWTTTSHGMRMVFRTAPRGSASDPIERMVIGSSGIVAIGTSNFTSSLDNSAQLIVSSTSRGFLPPRMTLTQKNAIASAASGLMVYDTTSNLINYYNGSSWVAIQSATGGVGTVTQISTGTGLTGGPVTSSGTISFASIAPSSLWANVSTATNVPVITTLGAGLAFSGTTIVNTSGAADGVVSIVFQSGLSGGTITNTGTVGISNNGIIAVMISANAVQTAAISNNNVTYAKVQQLAPSTLLGNAVTSTGNVAEITLGGGLAFSGSSIVNTSGAVDGVISINITQPASGLTFTGGPITSSGSIVAALANDLAAIEAFSTVGFATRIGTDTWAQRSIATGTGLSVNDNFGVLGNPTLFIANSGVDTLQIAPSAVTYAKIQNVAASRLLGNPTASAAAASEISAGPGIAFSGTSIVLNSLVKTGSFSRDLSITGVQSVTGVPFAAKAINAFGGVVGTTKYSVNGYADSSFQRGLANNYVVSPGTFDDTGGLIYIIQTGGSNFVIGSLSGFYSGGFDILWQKFGTVTGTASFYFEATG